MIETANEIGRQWAAFFGLAVVQNTIFLLVAFVVLQIFRKAPARIRFMIAAAGFVKLLIPPFVPSSLIESAPSSLAPVPSLTSNLVFLSVPTGRLAHTEPAAGLTALALLFILWVGAAVIYLGVAAYASFRLAGALRTARVIGAAALDERKIQIMHSSRIALPLTLGLFPRRIYVPAVWERWPIACRDTAIRHELAHIKRHDGVFKLIEILARALYLFHPLVWLLARRLDEYREMACDDAATGTTQCSRLEYSRNLVQIAETVARSPLVCESASALLRRRNELVRRINYLIKEGVMRRVSTQTVVILLAGLTLLVLPLSWYRTDAAPDKKTAAGAKLPAGMRALDISVKSADEIVVAASKATLETFGAALDKTIEGEPDTYVVNLVCANDVPMGVLFDVQRALQKKNLLKVNYNGDLPEAMPLVLPSREIEDRIKSIPDEDIAIVSVQGSGSMAFQNVEISVQDLPARVAESIKNNERLIVSIHMERSATYGDFLKALRAVKDGNAQRILINNPAE